MNKLELFLLATTVILAVIARVQTRSHQKTQFARE